MQLKYWHCVIINSYTIYENTVYCCYHSISLANQLSILEAGQSMLHVWLLYLAPELDGCSAAVTCSSAADRAVSGA